MYQYITLKSALLLIVTCLFFQLKAQNPYVSAILPMEGQAQVLATKKSDQFLAIGFGIRERVVFSFGNSIVPKGRQDIIIWIQNRTTNQVSVIQFSNADEALVSDMEINEHNGSLLVCGSFWDSLEVLGHTYRLSEGNKGLFIASIDLATSTVGWVKILDGNSSKTAAGLCTFPDGRIAITGFFSSGILRLEQALFLESLQSATFALILESTGQWLMFKIMAEGLDVRPGSCLCSHEQLVIAGQYRGIIDFGEIIREGRIQDFELFVAAYEISNEIDSKWVSTGRGVLDKSVRGLAKGEGKSFIVAGEIAGNMVFENGFALRSRGSLSDAFMLVIDESGAPVVGWVWSNSGVFTGSELYFQEGVAGFSGTFDGVMDVGDQSLWSPSGSRSGILFKVDLSTSEVIAEMIQVEGLATYLATKNDSYWILNLRGMSSFRGLANDVGSLFKTIIFEFENGTSTEEHPVALPLEVYPNPCTTGIWFSIDIIEVWLLDYAGNVVKQKFHPRGYLDFSSLPSGNYVLAGLDQNGHLSIAKVLKIQ